MAEVGFFWTMIKVAGLGSLVALDRTAALQLMLSRPLVAALWAGWLAGDWWIGLLVGATLELYFLAEVPVGTNIPTDDTLLALAAGGAAAALRGLAPAGTVVLIVLLTVLPWAPLTRKIDAWVREKNAGLIDEVETRLLAGSPISAVDFHLRGLLNFYVAALVTVALLTGLSLLLASLVLWVLPAWLYPLTDRLPLLFPLAGVLGLLIKMNRLRQCLVFAGVAFGLLVF